MDCRKYKKRRNESNVNILNKKITNESRSIDKNFIGRLTIYETL